MPTALLRERPSRPADRDARERLDVNEPRADTTGCRELNSVCDRDGEITVHHYSADACPGEPQ